MDRALGTAARDAAEGLAAIRPARASDAAAIAPFIVTAGGGVYEFLLEGLFEDANVAAVLAPGIAAPAGAYSHRQCAVAVDQGVIVGIAHAYPAAWMNSDGQEFLPRERREHFETFNKTQDWGSFFLSALAVAPAHRGRGLGSRLIEHTLRRAQTAGFDRLSLHVWADNLDARRLYERHGFETLALAAIPWHPRLPHEGGSVLMLKRV